MADTELLPCPWCGETPDVSNDASFRLTDGVKYGALQCCVVGPEVRTDYKDVPHWRERAIAAWNDRKALASRPAEVDDAGAGPGGQTAVAQAEPRMDTGFQPVVEVAQEVDKRHQDLIDVFDLTWNAAVESAAFYVDGHCADGAHHVEHILELVPPKIVVGGVTVAEVRARRAKADAELWETAMSHAANYVENHCIDGEDHASHMMSMKRPEFGAAPSHTTNKEKGGANGHVLDR